MLTIAIPTYNRNDILCSNLSYLLPHVPIECSILIIDNASEIPVRDSISDLINQYPEVNVTVVRNRYNLGLTGNLMKCFELCNDDWLWILGDDDRVLDVGVEQVLDDINRYNYTNFINYAWDEASFKRNRDIITNGVNELIDSFESIGVVLFISSGIYNVQKLRPFMSYGSFFQSSYAPHLAMLFMSLKDEGKCVLSTNRIVDNGGFDVPVHLRWDQMFFYQIILLLRLPLYPDALKKLRIRMTELTRLWTIEYLIFTLTFTEYPKHLRPDTLYKDIVQSFFYLDKRPRVRILSFLGYFIVRNPSVFRPILYRLYRLIKGKSFVLNNNLRI